MHRQYWNLIDVSWQWDKANAWLGVVMVGRDSIAWSQVAHHDNHFIFIGEKEGKEELAIYVPQLPIKLGDNLVFKLESN